MPDNYYSEVNENGVVTPFRDLAAYNGVIANTKLIKDTVGWSGKNKIPFPYRDSTQTVNNVTFTVNSNGTITINTGSGGASADTDFVFFGTWASSTAILPSGSYKYTIESTNSNLVPHAIFNTTVLSRGTDGTVNAPNGISYLIVRVKNGSVINNETIKPMIRNADILDDTYEPYFGSTAIPWVNAEKSVKKNLWNTDITNGSANVGMAVTHNSDKSIKLNGTTTAGFNFPHAENSVSKIFNLKAGESYIFSTQITNPNVIKQVYVKDTSSSEWRQIAEDTSNPKMIFTMPDTFYDYWVRLRIESGRQVNETFYPMIREATILDDTYAPYIPDNTELVPWSANNILGAKNLMLFPYVSKTKTQSGITFTLNSDGSVTINGTSTSSVGFELTPEKTGAEWKKILPNKVIMTGCPSGGASDSYYLRASRQSPSWAVFGDDYGDGKTLNISLMEDNNAYKFSIGIANNTTIDNLTFYPMLRIAEDTDPTYQPPTMTNEELTPLGILVKGIFSPTKTYGSYSDDVNDLTASVRYVTNSATNLPAAKYGTIFTIDTSSSSQGDNYKLQIFIPVLPTEIYTRTKDGGTWKPWQKYEGTAVS